MRHNSSARSTRQWIACVALCSGMAACGGGGSDGPGVGVSPGGAGEIALAPLPTPTAVTVPQATPGTPAGAAPAPAAPVATPTVPNPSAPAPAALLDASCGLHGAAGIEAEVLQRINALRAAGAVCGTTGYAATGPLAWNSILLTAAKGHSTDMAQKNYFAHNSLDGRTAAQRVTAAGYNWSTVGENIAGGQTSVEQVMNGWIKSAGHCQNLMNPNFRDVAVACMRNDAANYRLYWTMNLARSR